MSATDFSHALELIDRARNSTGQWLDSGGTSLPEPERFLSLHHHTDQPGTHPHACDSILDHPRAEPLVA